MSYSFANQVYDATFRGWILFKGQNSKKSNSASLVGGSLFIVDLKGITIENVVIRYNNTYI